MNQFTWPRFTLGFARVLCFHLELLATIQQVPVIRQVGVIPVQWQGEISPISDLARVRNLINSGFPELVRNAKRFQVLNDEIVSELWDSADGRRRLKEDFELDALVNLSIQVGADLQVWSLRVLSPRLDNYLLESERIPLSWFYQATDQEVTERLRELTYRLLNRYPIDVFVTSVQGRFVTLSAGREQNLFEGQLLNFHRFRVASVHPANNAWLSYDTSKLGEAKIIDAKNHSSVAQLTSLSYEGAIRVGDGARVEHIASRQLFARLADEDAKQRSQASQSAILGPRQLIEPLPKPPQLKPTPEPTPPLPIDQNILAEQIIPASPVANEAARPEQEPMTPPNLPPAVFPGPSEDGAIISWLSQHIEDIKILAGIDIWSASQGRVSSKAGVPLWLINRGEAHARMQWSDDSYSEINGVLGLGTTGAGNYFSFGLGGNWIRQIAAPMPLLEGVKGFEIGALSQIRSLSVTKENFGGIDTLELGGLARVYGQHRMPESDQTIEFRLGLELSALAWGQIGLAGLKKSVDGVLAYGMNGEAIFKRPSNRWDIGAFVKTRSGNYDNQLGSLGFNSIYFGILTRKTL